MLRLGKRWRTAAAALLIGLGLLEEPAASATDANVAEPFTMIPVPAGEFQMGRPYSGAGWSDELPPHAVWLAAYAIAKHPVTNAAFAKILNWAHARGHLEDAGGGPYAGGAIHAHGKLVADTLASAPDWAQIEYKDGRFAPIKRAGHENALFPMDDHPVVRVTWHGAAAFANWLSEREGRDPCYCVNTWERLPGFRDGYRLPTEAEWERAAAWDGARHWRYGFMADEIDSTRANFAHANPLRLTRAPLSAPVWWYNGQNPLRIDQPETRTRNSPSPIGAYDMTGNLREWTGDWYSQAQYEENAKAAPARNPTGPPAGEFRALRGGTWGNGEDETRTANRVAFDPRYRADSTSFRLCTSLPESAPPAATAAPRTPDAY